MRSPLPPTPPAPLSGQPHARWRSLARMLRARHARHAGRQPLDAVLRRTTVELFQPQGARVSSHLSFNCFVTLKVAPRAGGQAASTGAGRGRTRGVMAGGVMRERMMVVERQVAPTAFGRMRPVSSPLPPLVSRPLRASGRDGASGDRLSGRRETGGTTTLSGLGDRRSIGSALAMRTSAGDAEGMRPDGRVFAAPRGLLQTEDAAQTFGHLVRRLRRQESRVTPVTAVARRASEVAKSEHEESASHGHTLTSPAIGIGMPTAMQMQAAADVNIEALAGKVMQQIDRRLIAHRERMGRI
jgi:hypothetical protein